MANMEKDSITNELNETIFLGDATTFTTLSGETIDLNDLLTNGIYLLLGVTGVLNSPDVNEHLRAWVYVKIRPNYNSSAIVNYHEIVQILINMFDNTTYKPTTTIFVRSKWNGYLNSFSPWKEL